MTLVTPFTSNYPIKVIKWTNDELEKDREFIQKSEGVKKCFQGRLYMARAAGKLACEFIVDFFTTPAFAIAGPFARAPKVLCSGKEKFDSWIKKTEFLSASNVLKLALRTLAVACAAFITFIVGCFISANLAIQLQEKLKILTKKEGEIKNPAPEPLKVNKDEKNLEVDKS